MSLDDLAFYRATKQVMRCGHVSTGLYTTGEGEKIPICLNCSKKTPESAKEVVSLQGRIAECSYCKSRVPSSPDLFGFIYQDGKPFDIYYDGCRG